MIEEETNTDKNSEDYERIICYVSNKEYIPKIFGVSEKNFEEIIANLKANKNIDIYVNPVDKRADYDWGYCIQG